MHLCIICDVITIMDLLLGEVIMRKYIIFDLDDTLCDYKSAKRIAICRVNEKLNQIINGIDIEEFWKEYFILEKRLFRLYVERIIDFDEYNLKKFTGVIMEKVDNAALLSNELYEIYTDSVIESIKLFEDILPTLKLIKDKEYSLVILTNGPANEQRRKLKILDIEQYIDNIYISAETGLFKPDKKAFEYVLEDLKINPSQTMMVGNSLENDILGAEQIGIKTVLVDRNTHYNDYFGLKINKFSDLLQLV